jgi:hypothetical protein
MVDAGLDRPGGDGRGDGHYRGGLALTGAEGPPSRKIPPADLDIPVLGQLAPAQLPFGDALEPGPLEIISLDAPLGLGRSGSSR